LGASPRSEIGAQAWTAAALWAPALACWLVLTWGAVHMNSPLAELAMPMSDWSAANWLAVIVMWTIMMAAMMLPSIAPMVMVFANLNRKRGEGGRTLVFVAAYLALWTAFSGAATATQWALQSKGLISPMIVSTSPALTGALLIVAGVFQFTPLKTACLSACRSPLGFLMSDWRGELGARGEWGSATGSIAWAAAGR
jgi:predicted metal-binding membrane protein